jgi:hypothetical protein
LLAYGFHCCVSLTYERRDGRLQEAESVIERTTGEPLSDLTVDRVPCLLDRTGWDAEPSLKLGKSHLHVTGLLVNDSNCLYMASRFYCNMGAFTPAEGAHHKELTDKLVASWKAFVEMRSGYKFFFSPSKVSLAELKEWAKGERKCCPFFDFRIDSEHEGKLLFLELLGDDGIKPFIRSEFLLP